MKRSLFSLGCFLLIFFTTKGFTCTDFRLQARDGTILVTRSMEFAIDLQSNLRTSNRGRVYSMTAPNDRPGLTWKAKYGYVYLDWMNMDSVVDGMNEAGLSVEGLYLPGFAQYQIVPYGQSAQALPYLYFGDWVLSNFKSVAEVREALTKIYVFAEKTPATGNTIFPLHFSIFDASGKGIVVEYVEGKLQIYDHLGVLTNSPTYAWHLKNIQNYLHLAPTNPPSSTINGMTFMATGQGFGMIGLPGDISPPSRFVKTATLMKVTLPATDGLSELNLAEHIINNVDIPLGLVREPDTNKSSNEITQWVVFKDLTHKMFYYRTYNDMSLRAVSLAKIDFSENAARLKMPIAEKVTIRDMTEPFLKAKVATISSQTNKNHRRPLDFPTCKKELPGSIVKNFI